MIQMTCRPNAEIAHTGSLQIICMRVGNANEWVTSMHYIVVKNVTMWKSGERKGNAKRNMVKSIETVYNGYRFRSRLEAKWAVFFDALNMRYEYEPEGYELDGGVKYLPDFYLPDEDFYVEVKPDRLGADLELEKAKAFVNESLRRIIILPSIPKEDKEGGDFGIMYTTMTP